MFVLDTNVVSEMMLANPNRSVWQWLNGQEQERLYLAATSEAELRFGAMLVPTGRRRDVLVQRIDRFCGIFAGRILPFERKAAGVYAEIAAGRRAVGQSLDIADLQIAAIAQTHGMAVVTRNVRDFSHTGVKVINPWEIT